MSGRLPHWERHVALKMVWPDAGGPIFAWRDRTPREPASFIWDPGYRTTNGLYEAISTTTWRSVAVVVYTLVSNIRAGVVVIPLRVLYQGVSINWGPILGSLYEGPH